MRYRINIESIDVTASWMPNHKQHTTLYPLWAGIGFVLPNRDRAAGNTHEQRLTGIDLGSVLVSTWGGDSNDFSLLITVHGRNMSTKRVGGSGYAVSGTSLKRGWTFEIKSPSCTKKHSKSTIPGDTPSKMFTLNREQAAENGDVSQQAARVQMKPVDTLKNLRSYLVSRS